MTQLSFSEVEEWLDKHVDLCQDYFLRKAELMLINKWLLSHGFSTINDYINDSRRNSSVNSNLYATSEDSIDTEKPQIPNILINGHGNMYHKRTNSKKCLRHDFARTKSKSFVKSSDCGSGLISKESISKNRRSSLKDMRK